MRCCTCSKLVHLRRSFLSYSRFKTLAALTLGAVLPASTLFLLEVSHLLALFSSLSSSSLYTSTVQSGTSGPPLPTQRSRIHSSKPLTLLPPTSYLRTSPPPHASCCLPILPAPSTDLLRVLQWNARGLRARSSELLHFISFHFVDLICIQESNLSSSSSFRILDTLCDLIALTAGLAFFLPMTRTPAVASSFLSGRVYPSPSFPPLSTTNDPDTPTVFHRSSSDISFAPSSRTRDFPDISFAPSSLAPGRCFSTWV